MNLKGSRAIADAGKTDNQKACDDSRRLCSSCLLSLLGGGSSGRTDKPRPEASRAASFRRIGQPLPGVTVVVTSPMLQGVRTAVTSESGDYLIPLLPPGTYSVSFELDGFQTVNAHAAGRRRRTTRRSTSTMSLAGVSEVVTVVADAQPLVETAQVATNFKQDLMATLPSNRTIDAVMLMAPVGSCDRPARRLHDQRQSQSYENLYTVNGAVINENLRGAPYPLYIEDALQEVTVATAGVSAEYGRFAGGMVNAVTKSGGNDFSGSFRTSFANDYWRSQTPFGGRSEASDGSPQAERPNPMYEATFGGPVTKGALVVLRRHAHQGRRDGANDGRHASSRTSAANNEKRYEGKLTFAARPDQSFQASYIAIDQVQTNFSPSSIR